MDKEILVQYTEKDLRDHYFSMVFKSIISKILIAMIILITIFQVFLVYENNIDLSFSYFFDTFIPAIFLIIFFLIVLFQGYYWPKKYIKTNIIYKNEITYYLSDDNFEFHSVNGNMKYTWDELYKISEDEKFFKIFVGEKSSYLLPKRVFKDSSDCIVFSDFLKTQTKYEK